MAWAHRSRGAGRRSPTTRANGPPPSRAAREVLKLDPANPSALRVLARSSARLGLDDKAIALYGQQIAPGRMEAEDYILLGLALQRRGQPDVAARAWEKAMNADPIPPRTLEELARLLIQYHRREEAARAAERLGASPAGRPGGT